MKSLVFVLLMSLFSALPVVAQEPVWSDLSESVEETAARAEDSEFFWELQPEQYRRRCVNDSGCRPGVEICVGGLCQDRHRPPTCRTDQDCFPGRCIGRYCR